MKHVTRKTTVTFGSAVVFLYILAAVVVVRPILAALNSTAQFETTTTNATPAGTRAVFPYVAVDDNGKSHIVFLNQVGTGTSIIMYTNNLSNNFTSVQTLATGVTMTSRPGITVSGNKLYVTYTVNDQQLYYLQGTINGGTVTWAPRELVADQTKTFDGRTALDAAGNLHFTWIDRRCANSGINVYTRIKYTNNTWSNDSTPLNDCLFSDKPQIAITNDNKTHLVFQHSVAGGRLEAYYARQDASGWFTQNLSNTPPENSYNPHVATDGTNIYVVWEESIGTQHDIYLKISSDGGNTWSAIIPVSDTPQMAAYPRLAWSPSVGHMYITWSDTTNGVGGASDILFNEVDSSGNLGTPTQLTCVAGASDIPIMDVGGSRVQIVWQDSVTGVTRETYTIGGQVGNGLSSAGCALFPTAGPSATPTPGGVLPTNTPTVTPLPTYTPIPTDTPALTATPACTNCYFRPPYLLDDEPKEEDYIFYIVFSAVYIMTIHFAISIKKEFKIHLMVSCFVLGFIVGYFMKSLTVGFVLAIVLSLFLW